MLQCSLYFRIVHLQRTVELGRGVLRILGFVRAFQVEERQAISECSAFFLAAVGSEGRLAVRILLRQIIAQHVVDVVPELMQQHRQQFA